MIFNYCLSDSIYPGKMGRKQILDYKHSSVLKKQIFFGMFQINKK